MPPIFADALFAQSLARGFLVDASEDEMAFRESVIFVQVPLITGRIFRFSDPSIYYSKTFHLGSVDVITRSVAFRANVAEIVDLNCEKVKKLASNSPN